MMKSQPAFTYSKSEMETPEQFVKLSKVNNKDTRRRRSGVFIVHF